MKSKDRQRLDKLKQRAASLCDELSALKWAIDFIELELDTRDECTAVTSDD